MITVREINNYDEFNLFTDMDNDKLHVIKLGAEWCGPCRVMSNTISNLDENKVENVLFGEVDIKPDKRYNKSSGFSSIIPNLI